MEAKKRKRIESLVLKSMSGLDRTGKTTESYREQFKDMDDAGFDRFIRGLKAGENFYMEIQPHDNEPTLDDIKAVAVDLGVELEQYVYYPDQLVDGKPVRTRYKVPVGYLHIKRLQQVLSKKNSLSTDIGQRNSLTNQATGDSKVSRNSDSETYALTLQNADSMIMELNGPRADNMRAKNQMLNSISQKGFVSLEELESDRENNKTLLVIDAYLLAAGIKSDLVTNTNVLLQTEKNL